MDALKCLKSGNVILLQTDTLWGLSCDATNPDAVDAVIELKHRPENKSMIILVSDKEMLGKYAKLPEGMDIDRLRGISLVLKHKEDSDLCANLIREGTVCARIPDSPHLLDLISKFGKPIVSTSANISGADPPKSLEQIEPSIRDEVCAIVENPENTDPNPQPSTIIDLSVDGKLKVVRVGKHIDRVRKFLGFSEYSFQWPASDMKYPLLPLSMRISSNLQEKHKKK